MESTVGKGTTFSFQIWVELPDADMTISQGNEDGNSSGVFVSEYPGAHDKKGLLEKLQSMNGEKVSENTWEYGTGENAVELEKKMSKLILSLEMENWEKAEMFAETIKQLVEGAPREVKSAALRLKMSVQKGDYEKAVAAYELLQKSL